MSFELSNRAWEVSGIPSGAKLVLLRLADRANTNGIAFPGQTSLSKDCDLNVRTVREAIARLVKEGHISIAVPATFSTSATYRIHPVEFPSPPEKSPGGERNSAEEKDSHPSGEFTLSPPGESPAPLRVNHPPNHNGTVIEPSVTPNCAEGREEGNPEIEGQAGNLDCQPELGVSMETPARPPKQDPASRPRKRDEAFEALIKATGGSVERLTKTGRGSANKAMSDIRKASPDVTAEDIWLAVGKYRQEFPNSNPTPMAIAKHWDRLAPSEIDRLTALIDNHPANKNRADYVASEVTAQQKTELKELCEKRKRLRETP